LYNFKETGIAVMASQHNVGAPNTYYAEAISWLAKNPKVSLLNCSLPMFVVITIMVFLKFIGFEFESVT